MHWQKLEYLSVLSFSFLYIIVWNKLMIFILNCIIFFLIIFLLLLCIISTYQFIIYLFGSLYKLYSKNSLEILYWCTLWFRVQIEVALFKAKIPYLYFASYMKSPLSKNLYLASLHFPGLTKFQDLDSISSKKRSKWAEILHEDYYSQMQMIYLSIFRWFFFRS